MSKIYIEEILKEFKKTHEQLDFVSEEKYGSGAYEKGVLIGIQLCIKEIEKRLEEI